VRLRILSRGRGEYAADEARLARAILRHDLPRAVSVRSGFLSRDELRREIGDAHLIALPFQLVPSDMPLAVLEAMSWGRAVLGTRVACLTELLEGRGYLAAPGSPQSLAQEIARAALDPDERSSLERSALETAQTFPDWPEVVRRVAGLVEASVTARRPGLGQIEVPA
jgi:glycosyltransferase involved in cell wall biosynthesis